MKGGYCDLWGYDTGDFPYSQRSREEMRAKKAKEIHSISGTVLILGLFII